MLEGIPLEQYGMAGMVLIIALAVIWKGADILKIAISKNKGKSSDDDTPEPLPRNQGPGKSTMMLQAHKVQAERDRETLEQRFTRLEASMEKEIAEVKVRLDKKQATDDKQADDITELKAKVARIEGRMDRS